VLPGQVQGTKHSSLFCRRVSDDGKKVFHLDDVDGPVDRQQDPVVDGDRFETGDGLAKPVPDESEQLLEGSSGWAVTSQGEDEEDQISEAFETSEEDVGGLDILL